MSHLPAAARHLSTYARQLLCGIPIGRGLSRTLVPHHSTIDPLLAPCLVRDPAIVVCYAKLKATRRADFKGTSSRRRPGILLQPIVAAHRADKTHRAPPAVHGSTPGCLAR